MTLTLGDKVPGANQKPRGRRSEEQQADSTVHPQKKAPRRKGRKSSTEPQKTRPSKRAKAESSKQPPITLLLDQAPPAAVSEYDGAWLTPQVGLDANQQSDHGDAPVSNAEPTSSLTPLRNVFVPGFKNHGNTCFMNAALQCLLHCPPFVMAFLRISRPAKSCLASQCSSAPDDTDPNVKTDPALRHCPSASEAGEPLSFCAFCAMEGLVRKVYVEEASTAVVKEAHTRVPGTRRNRKQMSSPGDEPMDGFVKNASVVSSQFVAGRQEDAHEFTRVVLDEMVRGSCTNTPRAIDTAPSPPTFGTNQPEASPSAVHRVFGGSLQSRILCESCGALSTTIDPFLDISLEILHGVEDVVSGLRLFTQREKLDAGNRYHCEHCNQLTTAYKQLSLRRAPNVLTLHLKRFNRLRKDGRTIRYSEELNLTPFMTGCPSDLSATYLLSSVLVHHGRTQQSGHYMAYVRGNEGAWYLKDDATSLEEPLETVLKQEAYMLFYTRVDNSARQSDFNFTGRPESQVAPWIAAGRMPTSDEPIAMSPIDDFATRSSDSEQSDSSDSSNSDSPSLASTAEEQRNANRSRAMRAAAKTATTAHFSELPIFRPTPNRAATSVLRGGHGDGLSFNRLRAGSRASSSRRPRVLLEPRKKSPDDAPQ